MVGKAVARYIRDNTIAERISGRQKWTVEVRPSTEAPPEKGFKFCGIGVSLYLLFRFKL